MAGAVRRMVSTPPACGPSSAPATARTTEGTVSQEAQPQSTAPIHVLLVEDEPDLRSTLRYNLKRSGYLVTQAANGVEALDRVRQVKDAIDLVISDVMMPQMDGIQLARELRR